LPSGDILCADKRVGRGTGGYKAVEPPVPSYSGSGVKGIASVVQHSIFMRAFYTKVPTHEKTTTKSPNIQVTPTTSQHLGQNMALHPPLQ